MCNRPRIRRCCNAVVVAVVVPLALSRRRREDGAQTKNQIRPDYTQKGPRGRNEAGEAAAEEGEEEGLGIEERKPLPPNQSHPPAPNNDDAPAPRKRPLVVVSPLSP
jgi:hypothetical protein